VAAVRRRCLVPGTTPPAQAYYGAEGAVSEGFEFEVVGRPLEGWNINFGYSKFDAEDAAGNPVNTDQPSELLKLFTTYRLAGALDKLTIGGVVNYRGDQYSVGLNPVTGAPFRFEQEAYTLVSLMARYDLTDAVQIQANVVTDESYYSQIGFYSQYRYGAPRNYSVSLNYRF
jgi:outer membrane receptor for ferric coprogen and ferric-rhodotorulic acid